MAETSLSLEQFLGKLLRDEHVDVLREGLAWLAMQLMETEVGEQIGAALHERSPERLTHRNGYRERAWQTRLGSIELAIPKLRRHLRPSDDHLHGNAQPGGANKTLPAPPAAGGRDRVRSHDAPSALCSQLN